MSRPSRVRFLFVAIGLAVCAWSFVAAAREGLAQFLSGRALAMEAASVADQAVALGRQAPETHYARALLFERRGNGAHSDAVKSFEEAVALRPRDYALWLELGRAQDRIGNSTAAVAALNEATSVAPFYAQPRWQLGNALFRAGRVQEALLQLRLASQSDPKLALPSLALMWSGMNGDVAGIEKAFGAQGRAMETALARFLVKRGRVADAMRHFHAAGGISPEERRALTSDLLSTKDFEAAYKVWSADRENKISGVGQLENGGFEMPIMREEQGFGWQVVQERQGIRVALDPAAHYAGRHSLRIDWSGDADTTLAVASQLVLVEPNRTYRLGFRARGADLVMLGLPAVSVVDAGNPSANARDYLKSALAQSQPLPKGTSDWQEYSMEFATGASTRAVLIRIHRSDCAIQPCPAFGHAWFDEFALSK